MVSQHIFLSFCQLELWNKKENGIFKGSTLNNLKGKIDIKLELLCFEFNEDLRINLIPLNNPELETFEWWISGLRLNPLFFLISRAENFRMVDIGINA